MKKNIIMILFVLLCINFFTVGASALFKAEDISFPSSKTEATNVDDALNELYNSSKLSLINKLTMNYRVECSGTYNCASDVYFYNVPDIVNNYKHFKVNILSISDTANQDSKVLKAYSEVSSSWETIEFGKEYEIYSNSDNKKYQSLSVSLKSAANGSFATLVYQVEYYN